MPNSDRPAAPANGLLAALPRRDCSRLLPRLALVPLEHATVLYEAGKPIRHVYFPESGLVSLIAPMEDGALAEAGMVGREGMVGLPVFLGTDSSAFRAVVQVPGEAWRLEAGAFRALARRGRALNDLLRRYLHAFVTHLGQCSACNSHHSVEQRCCRWLLLVHTRIEADEFPLTHEFLAAMLGVRRTGVTEVAGNLQRAGLIRYSRGRVTILDREGLEATSCPCYRVIEAEFAALPDGVAGPPGGRKKKALSNTDQGPRGEPRVPGS
jgi:CRP-like cAMP-binding protein